MSDRAVRRRRRERRAAIEALLRQARPQRRGLRRRVDQDPVLSSTLRFPGRSRRRRSTGRTAEPPSARCGSSAGSTPGQARPARRARLHRPREPILMVASKPVGTCSTRHRGADVRGRIARTLRNAPRGRAHRGVTGALDAQTVVVPGSVAMGRVIAEVATSWIDAAAAGAAGAEIGKLFEAASSSAPCRGSGRGRGRGCSRSVTSASRTDRALRRRPGHPRPAAAPDPEPPRQSRGSRTRCTSPPSPRCATPSRGRTSEQRVVLRCDDRPCARANRTARGSSHGSAAA